MAKQVIFDSERFAKKQTLKRYLIPAVVLLVFVAIAVVLSLVLRGTGRAVKGGADTPYPYTWRAGKNGVATLELDRSAAPGYLWTVTDAGEFLSVEETQDEEKSRTLFTLTPQTAGRSVVVFHLRRENDMRERIYELSVLTETSESGRSLTSSLLSVSGKALQGTVRGGEDTDYPYTVRVDEDGDLMISITDKTLLREEEQAAEEIQENEETTGEVTEDEETKVWICASEDENTAVVMGVIAAENGAVAYLRPGTAAGTVQVRMTESLYGTELLLELEVDEVGAFRLLGHQMTINDPA